MSKFFSLMGKAAVTVVSLIGKAVVIVAMAWLGLAEGIRNHPNITLAVLVASWAALVAALIKV
jgi:hypothetical protein